VGEQRGFLGFGVVGFFEGGMGGGRNFLGFVGVVFF